MDGRSAYARERCSVDSGGAGLSADKDAVREQI